MGDGGQPVDGGAEAPVEDGVALLSQGLPEALEGRGVARLGPPPVALHPALDHILKVAIGLEERVST